jgi:hypothetical protein
MGSYGAFTVHLLLMAYPSGFGEASSTARDVVHFDISLPCGCCAKLRTCPSAVRPGKACADYASSIVVSVEQMILFARLAASCDALCMLTWPASEKTAENI